MSGCLPNPLCILPWRCESKRDIWPTLCLAVCRLLTPDHGFPVRLIIPGHIGGRMIKWLEVWAPCFLFVCSVALI